METAVAYIRVSSQRQVEEGSSLDSQSKQVEQFARSRGYELTRLFREEGETAKTDQRPRLQEMLKYCMDRKNGVTVVIIPKIDRLARNVNDYTNLKLHLSRIGIRLESLGERIEDTPVGRFTETILASVAQFDNEIRAERSKGGMIEAVSQGRWVWKSPAGYRNVRHNGKGTIEPDPKVGPVIQNAFRQLAHGHQSAPVVRAYLKEAGIVLAESSFYRMLANEIYIGRIHAFGKVFDARPPFVPLVDELTFLKAQAALRPSKWPQQYQMESNDFPLRGSILCECGHRYTASWSRGKLGERYPYYRCARCAGKSYQKKIVEGHFKLYLGSYKGDDQAWKRLEKRLVAMEGDLKNHVGSSKRASLERIDELKGLQDTIALKNATGVIPDDLARRQIERLAKDIVDVAADMPKEHLATDSKELVQFAKRFFKELGSLWNGFSLKTKKDLLHFMFPEGILFCPESGFRTHENSLSERFRRVIAGDNSHLVDPGLEFSNLLHEWLDGIYAIGNGTSSEHIR